MGQDYAARKAAKKRRKGGGGDAELASEGRRRRSKGSRVRRLCKGMCYQAPQLTPGDAEESGRAAAPAAKRPRLSDAAGLLAGSGVGVGSAKKKRAQPSKQSGVTKAGRAGPRLSTSVSTISNDALASDAQRARDQRGALKRPRPQQLPPMLAGLPEPIQAYLLREGFPEPTPVQSRYTLWQWVASP